MAKTRKDFKDEYKWNVKDIYKTDNDCIREMNSIQEDISKLNKYKGHILDNENTLYELLELDTLLSQRIEKVYLYSHINNDVDTLVQNYQELYGKAKNVYTSYLQASSYIVPELLKKDFKLIQKYIELNSKLKPYERELKDIFRNKAHILSEKEENVISSLTNIISSPDEIMGALIDSDFTFDSIIKDGKKLELTDSNFSIYLRSSDQSIRKQAFTNVYKEYKKYKTTLATIIRSEVEKNVSLAKLRKFNSSLERSLFTNEIDTNVYYNLIESVHKNLPSLYKYFKLKKRILNLDKLHIYDTYTKISKANKKYSFEDARDLVLKAVTPLGDNYLEIISKAFTDGWIDSCNNLGKRGGAYCTSCYDVHPYVLMSYEKSLNDVSTLAHELGHAMHYYYACHNQAYQDYSYSIFVAEVASQVNEILLCRYLLDHSKNKNEKIEIIDNLLQQYKSTIFRQTMFAEFELFMHEYTEQGNILTSESLCNKYLELNKLYFGKNVYVDEEIKYEWERIPHFYMNFYVYQYATGFAAAIYLANNIYEGNKAVRDNYLEFLKLGCSKNPIDSLKLAGVDMTKDTVMNNAIIFMDELIKQYDALQGSEKR